MAKSKNNLKPTSLRIPKGWRFFYRNGGVEKQVRVFSGYKGWEPVIPALTCVYCDKEDQDENGSVADCELILRDSSHVRFLNEEDKVVRPAFKSLISVDTFMGLLRQGYSIDVVHSRAALQLNSQGYGYSAANPLPVSWNGRLLSNLNGWLRLDRHNMKKGKK